MRSSKKYLDIRFIFLYNDVIDECTSALYKEIILIELYLIFGICMFGCAQTAFHLGRRDGIEATVDYFINTGAIEVDEPND